MALTPSYDILAAWEDLNILQEADMDEKNDPRRIDPREMPADIMQLDQSIALLEEKLAELKLERARLLEERALISRLPTELLSRIFEMGVDDALELLPTLGLVSNRWRSIALSTPSLWTYIVLDSDWGWRVPAFLRRTRTYLQRSQASKLFIDIDLCIVEGTDAETIMAELEPHLWRCYSFNMTVPDWVRMRLVQEHSSGLGPALEDLYLRIDYSESETHESFSILAQPCPRLGYVMLEHTPLDCIKVPLPALRQLFLLRDHRCHSSARIAYSFKDLMTVLSPSPIQWITLRSAVFSVDINEDIFRASPTPSELSNLKGITFDAVDACSISLLLESTTLPSLEILSVNSGEDLQWLTRISFAPSRFPLLRLLDLRNCNFIGSALVPLVRALHQLPQLTGLGISSPSTGLVGTRIFDMLTAGPDTLGEWLLPRLEALCLQSCGDVSGHEVLRVVMARRGAGAPDVADITYLKISQCYLLDPEVSNRLAELVDTVRTT